MTFTEKTASSAVVQLAMAAALREGIGPDEYRLLTGISESDIRPDTRISSVKFAALLDLARRRVNARDLVEEAMGVPAIPPFGTVIALATNAPTLHEAFLHFLHYRVLIGNADDVSLSRSGDKYRFDYLLNGSATDAFGAFATLAMVVRLLRQYTGKVAASTVLELTGSAFAPPSRLHALAGCSVRFEQSRNQLCLIAPLADSPYERFNETSYTILRRQADFERIQLLQRNSFATRVERHLTEILQNGDLVDARADPLMHMCDQLQISRSALYRRLQKEGTNFQRVLAKARLAEAERLLLDRNVSIADISDQLGFSSSAAFSRFFSDRNGAAPSRYQMNRRDI